MQPTNFTEHKARPGVLQSLTSDFEAPFCRRNPETRLRAVRDSIKHQTDLIARFTQAVGRAPATIRELGNFGRHGTLPNGSTSPPGQ